MLYNKREGGQGKVSQIPREGSGNRDKKGGVGFRDEKREGGESEGKGYDKTNKDCSPRWGGMG